jgi:hypothetical protein
MEKINNFPNAAKLYNCKVFSLEYKHLRQRLINLLLLNLLGL